MAVDSAIIPLHITLTRIRGPAVIADKLSRIGTTRSLPVAVVAVALADERERHLD
jgi:hypothetical protein